MSTTRIKEKLSQLVGSQLPEFIQNDYPTFIAFIESYYKFIEQDQGAFELLQNARSYADVDSTIPSFIQYFLSTYAKDIPASALVDKKILIKKIKDLYEAKGSELSFKLLFRIMFDTNVSVRYPYENVLRASDGKWQQKISLRLETVSGDRSSLENKTLKYTSGGVLFETQIVSTKILTPSLIEVFLNPNQIAPSYTLNDNVEIYNNDILLFVGKIKPTVVNYKVVIAGTGFKVGQIFALNYAGGVGSLIKITQINQNGGIQSIQFLTYGFGYPETPSTFRIEFDASKNISETSDVLTTLTQGFGSLGTVELIEGYDELDADRYFQEVSPNNYVENTYLGLVTVTNFNNSTFFAPVSFGAAKPEDTASILFTIGTVGRYPGSYFKNDGFLSEADVRLEDSLLYQPFAYQTVTDIDVSEFFTFVKKLIHPAGQNLFNNRLVSVDLDFSSNVSTFSQSNVFTELRNTFTVASNSSWTLQKPILEDVLINEEITVELLPFTLEDSITVVDDLVSETGLGRVLSTEQTDLADSILLSVSNEINNQTNVIDSGTVSTTGVNNPNRYFESDYEFELYSELAIVSTF